uniref:Cytochrome c domain-containing protein n=1 Tax=Alexandrium catenella TaxID=2925 RepID=A0A7S1MPH2_ALECA
MVRSKGPRALACAAAAAAVAIALRGQGSMRLVPPGAAAVPGAAPPRRLAPPPRAARAQAAGRAGRVARKARAPFPGHSGLAAISQQPEAAQPRRTALAEACRGLAAVLFCGAAAAVGGAAKASADPDASGKDFVMPPLPPEVAKVALPEEEARRRRTASSNQVKGEKWFKLGERGFRAHCAGCHPIGLNVGNQEFLLSKESMERTGYADPQRIQYIMRYGSKKMPGFAADCAEEGEYAQCQSTVPLSEERLRNIQDFVMNRANSGWKDLN